MRNCCQIFFITVFIFCGLRVSAQAPQFHFETITTANGLSSNDITCIYQDHEGFLWIGTHFGLNRYDGNEVQTFYHNSENPNSLSGNDIVDILEDNQNIFWIATKDGGLTRYDPSQLRDKQFRQFQNNPADKNSIATNRLNCLYDYDENFILVGAEVCVGFFINKKTFQIRYVSFQMSNSSSFDSGAATITPSSRANWIHHLDGNDSLIYASFLIGCFVYSVPKYHGGFNIPTFPGTSPAFSISSFYIDGNNAWLAAWSNGLFIQKGLVRDTLHLPEQKKVLDINDPILSIASWDKNYMLAGSKSNGLYIVDKRNYSSTNLRHDRGDASSIASNKVNCIFKDRQGILWIGTSSGLSKYNPVQWQFYAEPLSANQESDLTHFSTYIDGSGAIRVCTSEGIYKKAPGEKEFHLVRLFDEGKLLSPTLIFEKQDGDYYLCSEQNFFRYDPLNERVEQLRIDSFGAFDQKRFYTITFQFRSALFDTIDGHPFLICGILGDGLAFYDLNSYHFGSMVSDNTHPHSISDNLIHSVIKDHEGNIWTGTAHGLCKWNKSYPPQNDFASYLNTPGNDSTISGNDVTGIYVDEENNLWITTNGNGLNEFDGSIFHHYFTSAETGNNMLGIYADNGNHFWIPTPKGFEVFNRVTKDFDEITVPNAEWILKYPAKLFKDHNGTFSYGAGNYFITFNPDSFRFENVQPEIYLTDFKVMEQSIYHTDDFNDLEFPYNKNFFTINFSSLQLSQPASVQYQYQLAGLNSNWVNAGREGKASFTSLPPGEYQLKVKVTGTNGVWSKEETLVSFSVMKPFWKTWWFVILCTVLSGAIIYIIFRFRLRQLVRLQEIRHRIATDLHDDIGSALSSISISSQLVKKFSDNNDEKVDKILNRINTTSRETLDSMSDIVWAINPKNDSGKNMVMKMQRVATDLLESKGINVKFGYDDDFEKMKLGMEGRKNLFFIFKEAINNISKHSGCSNVGISLVFQNHHLAMNIEDDGKGFIVTKSSLGNGMDSMKHRSDQLGGNLRVVSSEGGGTKISLSVDLTKIRD